MSNFDISSIKEMKDLTDIVLREKFKKYKYRVSIYSEDENQINLVFGVQNINIEDFGNVYIKVFKDKATLSCDCESNGGYETEFEISDKYTQEEKIIQILFEWYSCYEN